MYTIILQDGTELKNLELNGNNFISEEIIDDSVFENNLATVVITDGAGTYSYTDMVLVNNRIDGGKTWFILREKTEQEKKEEAEEREISEIKRAMNALLTGKEG